MKLRKIAVSALAAGMATLGLTACQTASNNESSAEATASGSVIEQEAVEGATKLELWTFQELHAKYYTDMADQWNEENPDKKVQISANVMPYDDMHNKLQIALTSGEGAPDVVDIEAGKFPQFVQGTPALMDLTEAAAPYADDIVQARLDLFSKDGKVYGLDFHVGTTVAFYNTELLEAADIDYTTIKTWDDLKEAGSKYYDATGKYLTTVDTSAMWQTSLIMAQLGGEYFTADGKINVNSPEMNEALGILKGLQDANAAAVPAGGQPDTEEAYGAYNNGDFAAAIMPFWFTSRYTAYMPDFSGKIAIAPAPTTDDPAVDTVGGGGTGTAVVAASENADLAAEFVAWAKLSYEGNVATWQQLGFDPLNTTVWEDEEITHDPENAFVQYFKNNPFDALLEVKDSIGNLTSFTNVGMPSVNNLFGTTTLNDIFEGGVPVADALSQAQSDLENELG
ncbi:ABC transporter substrate-binding protein [Tessaracoccus palaemonis]|uniref:Extracellular solute-binding protein n=1 Tax=Tessaracoccus palaemonis TaxID=2829499 RepID=A0ABX8SG23_9ACTN|nr:extracellular solute-binding protein [Tessaracoccus palaemonis]QXT62326.1 extracellular solute-binding protein [Tessaracoccus palaemonis]